MNKPYQKEHFAISPSLVLVEDDPDLRDVLAESLRLQDFEVQAAGSALDFYRLLGQYRADVVVLDLGLPDIDGLNIAGFLRQQTNMGIIAISADASQENRLRSFEHGADLFFAKPLHCQELGTAAHRLIQRLRGRRDGSQTTSVAPPASSPVAAAPVSSAIADDAPCWVIDSANWLVRSPKGEITRLAAKEMRLVTALGRVAGATLSRDDLRQSLGYPDSEHGERSLEALIHRVRNKLRGPSGGLSPIQTVHGAGYLFSAAIRLR